MLITRTPFRISFCGGGSDLPAFFARHNGCVVSTSINKYMYVSIHPTFNGSETVIKYSVTEEVKDIDAIKHPIARSVLKETDLSGVEITSVADIPAGTGLGSSSTYTVSLIHAVNAYLGKYRSKEYLASKACEVEIDRLGEPIGKQDQYAAAYGGLNFITFLPNGSVNVEPIIIQPKTYRKLEKNLLMFYTGTVRSASKILVNQSANVKQKDKFESTIKLTKLARRMKNSLENQDISEFGHMLHEGWLIKKNLANGITNPLIEKYYNLAMANGAEGGKLLGAGSGGFLLFYCEKENQPKLREALKNLSELDFNFDNQGSTLIYVGDKYWD